MLQSLKFVSLILLLISDVVLCQSDYKFNNEVNGWLKLHEVPADWSSAFLACHYEGAVLASPLNAQLAYALHVMMIRSHVDRPIYLGANAMLSDRDFISLEGVPLNNMAIAWGSYGNGTKPEDCLTLSPDGRVYISSCDQWLPFICYKKRDQASQLNECGTFDVNYKLNETTGSCYKLHEQAKTWNQAHKICIAEGGHLVVINDEQEADVVVNLIPELIPKLNKNWDAITHIGLLDRSKDYNWITVTGDKIEDVYNKWARGQPDNIGVNICACLLRDGTLDEHWCGHKLQFVCEKDPNGLRFERISDTIAPRKFGFCDKASGCPEKLRPHKH